VKPAANAAPDSLDMHDVVTGKDKKGRDWLVEHAGTLGLIEGNWKYIAPSGGQKVNPNTHTEMGNDPAPQLYDLSKDIGETENLAEKYPDRVKAMAAQLARIKGE
jgi:arylsulfatase A